VSDREEARSATRVIADPGDPRTILAAHGLKAKKTWGQNFLRDRTVLDRIVALTGAGPGDRVVEFGAGLGHLTARLLATGARVVAIERDRDLVPILERTFEGQEGLEIVAADAKTIDLSRFAPEGGGGKVRVVGNLPYHISTPILFHLLEHHALVENLVVMVQREVARRLAASPGGKDYGILGVRFGLHFRVHQAFEVGATSFVPPPKVVSAVVRLEARAQPLAVVGDPELFRRIVKGAFGQRRKTLQNALRAARLAEPDRLAAALLAAGIDGGQRAERIPIEAFAALARGLCQD